MSKQINQTELAEIVTKLLTTQDSVGELAEFSSYQSFMTQIAQAVCEHCGGEILNKAEPLDDVWYIGIHGNDSLPSTGGVWSPYDREGELFNHKEDEQAAKPRDIFDELCSAVSLTIGDTRAVPGQQPLTVRRDLLATEILSRYPADSTITTERFQADDSFGECLIWLAPYFSIAAWEGRNLAEFLGTYATSNDAPNVDVLQYRTKDYNEHGTHLGSVTLYDLRNATTLGESGWLLPNGRELWLNHVQEQQSSLCSTSSQEVLPGACREEITHIMMQDVVGDYDTPDKIPEWKWVEDNASFAHVNNGEHGVWEFVLNLSRHFTDAPDRLKPVLQRASADCMAYVIFHQGT